MAVRSYLKLGVRMTEAQKNDYVHCWNVVGFLMGIREELLPANYEESRKLYEAIRAHQAGPSTAGRALTAALMNLLEDLMPPGTRHLPVILTRYLVGSETAAMIGLRQAPYLDRIAVLVHAAGVAGYRRRRRSFPPGSPLPVCIRVAAQTCDGSDGQPARSRTVSDSF